MWALIERLTEFFPILKESPWWGWVGFVGVFVAAGALLGFASVFAGVTSWVERRVAGRIQSRIGPNRVGPQGFFQWIADGLKVFLKEDLCPEGASPFLFRIAPYLVFAGMFGTFVALPFGANLVASNLDVGVFYICAITSLVVVGILLGGWSSNSKWSLFGGLRSAAQIISYEIPVSLSILSVVVLSGSLSTQSIISAQGGLPWDWFVCHSPFAFGAFIIYVIGALAEGNRTPFDLPEAESELVAGYCTEYSGFRFLLFFFAEWANLWVMSAMAVLCFLGGWRIPFLSPEQTGEHLVWMAISAGIFAAKTSVMVFIVIQLRWTLPRFRIDQMMGLCWKYLTPLAFFSLAGVMAWSLIIPWGSLAGLATRFLTFGAGSCLGAWFIYRVIYNYASDAAPYRRMTGRSLWYAPWKLP